MVRSGVCVRTGSTARNEFATSIATTTLVFMLFLSFVASDNKPHKVTVVVLTLESTFQHYSPVCKVASAYLQATCTNTSDYTLLPSKSVCVFAGTSRLRRVDCLWLRTVPHRRILCLAHARRMPALPCRPVPDFVFLCV